MAPQSKGFTLIEVLVAFTILAVALGVLLPAFSSGLSAQDRAETHGLAALKAHSKLAEVGNLVALRVGTTEGDYEDGTTWRVEITPYEEPDLEAELPRYLVAYTVMVEVSASDGPLLSLSTLRLGEAQ